KQQREEDEEYFELLRLFADAFDQIERNYVKEVSRRELMEAAVRGALSQLDPYSSYISPEELDRFRSGVESEFGGIGIEITRAGSPLVRPISVW
ncbi:MAG: S41 family peptidase, partial [Anaerolineae bacterium]